MATTIQSTSLDFASIKSNLKTFLKSKSEFADYDFEASGLSNILDVLAYNTHYNGLIANFALNETFLDTSQLRSSVVSHAEALGYEPRSVTSSTATVKLSATISGGPATWTLPSGTVFNTTVDDVAYSFVTREAFSATNDGNDLFTFKTATGSEELTISEGTERSKTFLVGETDERQIYVIPDITMDTNTLKIDVYETSAGTVAEEYTNLKKAVTISTNSTHFEIKEVPNGYFEVDFGDGIVTGKAPAAGNRIVASYLSSSGSDANGATIFTAKDTLSYSGSNYTLGVQTVSNSSGGSLKESIDSIRNNARTAFSAQQRLVTARDYEALILSNYSSDVNDVSAWGGEENDPIKYGTIYIGLQYVGTPSTTQKTTIQDTIKTNLITPLSIVGTVPEFVDATTALLELETFFNFDPNLTSKTSNASAIEIDNTISSHFTSNLGKFDQVFRRSLLTAKIDDIDDSILNSRMNIKINQSITPSTSTSSNYDIVFPMKIATNDDVNYRVTTSNFTFKDKTCSIKNKLKSDTLQIIDTTGAVVSDNVGQYYPSTGKVSIIGFLPQTVVGGDLKVTVTPANESTIKPLRNYVLQLDTNNSTTTPIIDYQNTESTLT